MLTKSLQIETYQIVKNFAKILHNPLILPQKGIPEAQRVHTHNNTAKIVEIFSPLLIEGKKGHSEDKDQKEHQNHLVDHLLGDLHEENRDFVKFLIALGSVVKQWEEDQEGVEAVDHG